MALTKANASLIEARRTQRDITTAQLEFLEPKVSVEVELTDTFCGEANYSWVVRYQFYMPKSKATDRAIVQHAKKLLGLNAVECERITHGDGSISLRPYGLHQVVNITFPST